MIRLIPAVTVTLAITAPLLADEKDTQALDGSYTLKSMMKAGQAVPNEVVTSIESVTLAKGILTMKVGDNKSEAKILVDSSKKPATLQFHPAASDAKNYPGLVKIDKDEIVIVFSESAERPKDFDGAGEKTTKLVLSKKAK